MSKAAIFNSDRIQALLPGIKLYNDASVLSGDIDPTLTAIDALKSSLYLSTLTGKMYVKQDDGLTTNWSTSDIDLGGKYVRTTRFAIISSGTSGQITLPPQAEVVLDDFGGTVDAVLAQVSGGKPLTESAVNAFGSVVATTFDSGGNYVFTDTPASYPVAIIYRVQSTLNNFDSTSSDIWGEVDVLSGGAASGFVDFNYAVTDGQGATTLAGQSIDGDVYTSAWFIFEVIRGTTVAQQGFLSFIYRDAVWKIILGGAFSDNSVMNGLTFTVTQTGTTGQLKVALDSGAGDGTLKFKRILFAA